MIRNLVALGIGLIVLIGVGQTADAEEPKPGNKVSMGEVVVTASRQQEEIAFVPAYISVVTAKEIEASTAQNVAEVLSRRAGVHVSDISGNQRNYSVDLRGFGGSTQQHLLLLVDGRRVNLDDLSGADWNLIPLERIERIEIMRGSRGTVLYGDNATAGVINIITKEGSRLGATTTAAYGSYGKLKGNASVSGVKETLSYDISGSYQHSDGFRDNSGTINKDIGANLRIDLSDRIRVHLSTGYHYDDTRNPGKLFLEELDTGTARTDTNSPGDFSKVADDYIKIGLEADVSSDLILKLETSARNRDKEGFGTFSGGFFNFTTQTGIYTVSPRLVFQHGTDRLSNRLIVGTDYIQSKQDYDSASVFFGDPSQIIAKLEKANSAYFIHDELEIGPRLRLSGGFRSDRATFSYTTPSGRSKRTLDEESLTAGVNYAFDAASHVYISYSSSFRYPVLDEQFSYLKSSIDTTVDAQTSDNIEIGAAYEVFAGLVAGVNLFRIETDDEIFYNNISFANENMDGTTVRRGAELSLAWQSRALELSGTYTRTDTEFDGGPFDGKQVPFVPVDRVTANASYRFECGLTLGLNALYAGESYFISDFENSFDKTDAFTVVNAKVQYDWLGVTFFADLNNLLSEEYSAYSVVGYNPAVSDYRPSIYPSPEFNALVGITARFGAK